MTDYATLLRDHVTLKVRSIDRIFLAYVPNLQTVGQVCKFLRWQRNFRIPSSGCLWQNRRAVYPGHRSLRRTTEDPARGVPEGTRQRGTGSPLFGSRSKSGRRSRGCDRNGTRESLSLALLAAERAGKGSSSAHGLGPADGLPEPFLGSFQPFGSMWRTTAPPCRPVAPVTSTVLSEFAMPEPSISHHAKS